MKELIDINLIVAIIIIICTSFCEHPGVIASNFMFALINYHVWFMKLNKPTQEREDD